MRIFTKKELIGEWSNEKWRFRLFDNNTLKLIWLDSKDEVNGTFQIYENFLIFEYFTTFQKLQWTSRIEDLIKGHNLVLTDLSNHVGQLEELKRTFFELDLIKQFDFEILESLTIDEIKDKLSLYHLHLNTIRASDYKHWDNDNRFAVEINKDLAQKIKEDRGVRLNIKKEIIMAELGYYTNFLIVENSHHSSIVSSKFNTEDEDFFDD